VQARQRGPGQHRDLLGGQCRVGAERCVELAGGHDRHALGVSTSRSTSLLLLLVFVGAVAAVALLRAE
jgi:hypothetical protein